MKKIFLLIPVISAFSLVSCTMDRTCTCTTTTTGSNGSTTTTVNTTTYHDARKKDARARCMGETYTSNGTTYDTRCKLTSDLLN